MSMLWTSSVSRKGSATRRVLFSVLSALFVLMSTSVASANDVPVIQSFAVGYLGDGWWGLYGTVEDEDPDYCEVFFSGVLEGYSVDVSSNGEFSLILQLPYGTSGIVDANALDPEYEWSDTVSDQIGGLD
jgi:hypothetical protein